MRRDEKKKIMEKEFGTFAKEIAKLRLELARDLLDFVSNKPKDVNLISKKKRKLAILLTAQRAKQMQISS